MTKRQFEKYNTAYQSLLKQRYIEKIPENNDTDDNYDLFRAFNAGICEESRRSNCGRIAVLL